MNVNAIQFLINKLIISQNDLNLAANVTFDKYKSYMLNVYFWITN